jgi:purine-binding chemotaxis protein CheW
MEDKSTFILFTLSDDTFAVDVKHIIHTMEIPDITPLPKTPIFVKGISIFRGNVLPIIDLRIKFNLQEQMEKYKGFVVVSKFMSDDKLQEIGLIVDHVLEVAEFSEMEIGAYPELGSRYNIEFITGFVKQEDKIIMVLNIEKILSSAEIEILKKKTKSIQAKNEKE